MLCEHRALCCILFMSHKICKTGCGKVKKPEYICSRQHTIPHHSSRILPFCVYFSLWICDCLNKYSTQGSATITHCPSTTWQRKVFFVSFSKHSGDMICVLPFWQVQNKPIFTRGVQLHSGRRVLHKVLFSRCSSVHWAQLANIQDAHSPYNLQFEGSSDPGLPLNWTEADSEPAQAADTGLDFQV